MKLLNKKRQIKLDSVSNVAVTVAEIDKTYIAVQLFSYADKPVTEQVSIKINAPIDADTCILYCFGQVVQKLSPEADNSFIISGFQRHAALIFKKNSLEG
ncbi:MAG: hypothetical protein L3J71_06860 [Victivallaceae bacterium]|nr:hypothetical protein [Victivallaceae bacterium]